MLNIATAPNPVLSQKAKRVNKLDKAVLGLIEEMKKTLLSARDPVGVGLAAPQVGRSLQIFIAKPTPKSKIQVFINPKIDARGGTTGRDPNSAQLDERRGALMGGKDGTGPRATKKSNDTKLEGCLSLKDIWGEVNRNPTIKLRYQLITNNHELITKTHTFSGFIATIIQHENDHLNGILFPKRVLEQKGKLYKSHKDEKNEDVFEEIEI